MPCVSSSHACWLAWAASAARFSACTAVTSTKASGFTARPSPSFKPCGRAWYTVVSPPAAGRGGWVRKFGMPRAKVAVTASRAVIMWSSM